MPFEVCTHPWKYYVEPFRIAGNLSYVGNADVSSHLIDTGDGLILLDTTYPQTLYLLLESIRRLGFNPADVRYILHCHAHIDHLGGTRALVELTGAKTFLGAADIEILKKRPELTGAPECGVEFYENFKVDVPLVDSQTISLGHTSIECLHTPGHTSGSMSYFFEIDADGNRYKVGIHGGPGLNTLSREYLGKYGLPASRRTDYIQSLQRLKRRSVDIFIGAHPSQNATLVKRSAMKDGKNPFLDQTAWPTFLESLEKTARAEFGLV